MQVTLPIGSRPPLIAHLLANARARRESKARWAERRAKRKANWAAIRKFKTDEMKEVR